MVLFLGCPDDDASVTVLCCMCSLDDDDACLGVVLFLVCRGGASYTSDSSRSTGFEAEVPIASSSARVGGGAQPIGFAGQGIDAHIIICQKVTGNSNGIIMKRKYIDCIDMSLKNIIDGLRTKNK